MNAYVSPSDLVQADRILRIETPLGADALLPERFELVEGVAGFESADGFGGAQAGEAGLFKGRIAVRSPVTTSPPPSWWGVWWMYQWSCRQARTAGRRCAVRGTVWCRNCWWVRPSREDCVRTG